MRCENRLELQVHKKAGKSPPAPKDNTSEGSSNITLNAATLGFALAC